MLKNKSSIISLLAIFSIALFLRAYRISTVVPILNRDEAALGYTARLLTETGRDEWGVTWPISPKSFGDSKLIGYPTLLVGLFQFLPFEDWVVRTPAILAGSLLPIIMYCFCRTLGIKKDFALLAALSIAVNPVFVHFSRFAYEAMVAVTYFMIATTLLLHRTISKKWRLVFDLIAALFYLASLLTYNTPLLLLPLVLLLIPFIRRHEPTKHWLVTIGILSITWIIALFLLFPMLSQKSGITIFSDQTYIQNYPYYRESFSGLARKLFGNQYVYYAKTILLHIWQSFSPEFLVLGGGAHPWHSLNSYGHISWVIYIGAIAGLISYIIAWIKRKTITPNVKLVIILLFISLVPASITVDAPHATRSLLFFIILVVLAMQLYQQISNRIRWLFIILVLTTCAGGMTFFIKYLQIYPMQARNVYQIGFTSIIHELDQNYPNIPIAIVDPGGFQYILLAWYGNYTSAQYFQTIVKQQPNTIGLQYGERLGRYHFIVQSNDRIDSESIIVSWEEKNQEWQYQLL